MTLENLLNKIKEYNPQTNIELVKKAYNFSAMAHQGQKRFSGENYISHPLAVALSLAKMHINTTTIVAGLLHDVVDDTKVTLKEIENNFGKEIAFLVDGVSKVGKVRLPKEDISKPLNQEQRLIQSRIENLRKLFIAMAKDIRVILIKLTDRLHNMQTLQCLKPEKQKRIALETLEIYAPLANRLGMGELKGDLEDLAFPYVYPQEYRQLLERVKEKYQEREKYITKVQPLVYKELMGEGIKPIEIHSRAKYYYSLFQKLKRYENDLDKIYDLVALRIIVKDVAECYKTLGIIHKLWKPLPGRIKDYIALPKPSGYKSLHTTVLCIDGKITEIQIRTSEMHRGAEYGIAAHWYYTEQKGLRAYIKRKITKPPEHKFGWIKQLKEWHEEIENIFPDKYLELLKIEFFNSRIFVLTPKGDVIDLPQDGCAVDFAYAIHTEIGNRCAGAKINGKLESLSHPLKNGDVVEIIVNKNKKPSQDWLSFVKTDLAKSQIKKELKEKKGL